MRGRILLADDDSRWLYYYASRHAARLNLVLLHYAIAAIGCVQFRSAHAYRATLFLDLYLLSRSHRLEYCYRSKYRHLLRRVDAISKDLGQWMIARGARTLIRPYCSFPSRLDRCRRRRRRDYMRVIASGLPRAIEDNRDAPSLFIFGNATYIMRRHTMRGGLIYYAQVLPHCAIHTLRRALATIRYISAHTPHCRQRRCRSRLRRLIRARCF